jgi:hypothetical protein
MKFNNEVKCKNLRMIGPKTRIRTDCLSDTNISSNLDH